MRRRKTIIAAAAALLLVAGGWYWGSPWWTLRQMREAAEARDAQALSSYVDFPTLRETTKSQLRTQLMAQADAPEEKEGFGALGAAFGMALMGPMVDTLLTPEALRLAFLKTPQRKAESGGKQAPLGADASEAELVRTSFGEFRLRKKDSKGEEGDLIFRRHGLGWKLEEIRIPSDPEPAGGRSITP
jgi:hypothetical protein